MHRTFHLKKIFFIFALAIFFSGTYWLYEKKKTESSIAAVIEWGRLAYFPEEKQNFSIQAEGGLFTRSFVVEFDLAPESLEEWIKNSPGFKEAEISSPSKESKLYNIAPGGGANKVTVEIIQNRHVKIYASWS